MLLIFRTTPPLLLIRQMRLPLPLNLIKTAVPFLVRAHDDPAVLVEWRCDHSFLLVMNRSGLDQLMVAVCSHRYIAEVVVVVTKRGSVLERCLIVGMLGVWWGAW